MCLSPIARAVLVAALLSFLAPRVLAAPPRSDACTRVEFTDMVSLGQEWKTPLGEGWVFRVLPIVPGPAGYTGWDLVVDRDPQAGYPDALLLATPPYNALNEREIGTTFGLRAQDAIGWNPRSFHFLTNPAAFLQGQKLFLALSPLLEAQSGGSRKKTRPWPNSLASSPTCSLARPLESYASSMPVSPPEPLTPLLSPSTGHSRQPSSPTFLCRSPAPSHAFRRTRLDPLFHHSVAAFRLEAAPRRERRLRALPAVDMSHQQRINSESKYLRVGLGEDLQGMR